MRDKTYDGWTEAKECWRVCCATEPDGWNGALVCVFPAVQEVYSHWWQSNPNPHGWDISLPAKHADTLRANLREDKR